MGRKFSLQSVVCLSAIFIIVVQITLFLGYLRFWSDNPWSSRSRDGCGNGNTNKKEAYIGSLRRQVAWLRAKSHGSNANTVGSEQFFLPDIPVIFVITPTYERPNQMPELTRLAQSFLLVPNLYWILVEDAENTTETISSFLLSSGLVYTHLSALTPSKYKLNENDPNWLKPRGVYQRNMGLKWIVEKFKRGPTNAIVYFADDDNTYSHEIFEEMRHIQKVGVWPVGLSGGLLVESPLVRNGKVVGWNAVWKRHRSFAMDMAGFAVKMQLILEHPEASFKQNSERGFLESSLLQQLEVSMTDLEPLASNCTKVLVWHTRTEKPKLKGEYYKSLLQKQKVEM